MNDHKKCIKKGYDYRLKSYQEDGYVKAWNQSVVHTPPRNGCNVTYYSYKSAKLKYRFSDGDFIKGCTVTLEIYDSDEMEGPPLVSATIAELEMSQTILYFWKLCIMLSFIQI